MKKTLKYTLTEEDFPQNFIFKPSQDISYKITLKKDKITNIGYKIK
jgi:hypothetical protein